MAYTFNPFTGNLDVTGAAAVTTWKSPVTDLFALPASGNSVGDVRVTLDTNDAYVWDGASWVFFGLMTVDQTITGVKTFQNTILADGTIDVSSGTLSIGIANAEIINIGSSGATVNIQGSTTYQDVTNLQVTDKLITVNKSGSVGSGTDSGIEIEENNVITGYVKTSTDRNSWRLKAPNTSGDVTLTPGASGITIDQSSHNPVTLAAVGSTPNANGASLSTQQLTLQPADGTNPGVITAGNQTIGGNKTFTGSISASNLSGTNTGDQTITLTGDVTGSGTGSFATTVASVGGSTATNIHNAELLANAATNNNTNSTIVKRDGSGNFSAGTITASLNGSANGNLLKASGDINETSFSAANNQAVATNVTGLAFANATVRAFEALLSVYVSATSSLYESIKIHGIQKGSGWEISQTSVGDASGFVFTITSSGQIQYVNNNYAGFSSAIIKFRATTVSV